MYGQWETDKRITNYPDFDYGSSNNAWTIAVWDTMVHIVWEHRLDNGPANLHYRRSTNSGESFLPDASIMSGNAHFPSIAVCDSIVHVVWHDLNWEIYYKKSIDNGDNWEFKKRLAFNSSTSGYSSMAVRDSIVHVVWQDKRGGNYEIYYNRSIDNGDSWETDRRLSAASAVASMFPSVADRDSIVHVVWDDGGKIYYNRSIDNGDNWGADIRLTATTSCYSSIAVRDSIVHVVWNDMRDGNYEIYYNRSINNGDSWETTDRRLTADSALSCQPSIAVRDSVVHVVWYDKRNGPPEIYYKRSIDNGINWSPDERLTTFNISSYQAVACWDCPYDVHVVWTDEKDGNQEIYYKRHKCEGSGIDERNKLKGKREKLKVYPNPFIQSTAICYYLPTKSKVSLKIYNVTGRTVKTLVNEEKKSGSYNISFDATGLTSGIYFAKLAASDYKIIKKLILLK